MQLPLVIGKNSSNQLEIQDLCTLPHLFVAYSNTQQLHYFLQACVVSCNTQFASGGQLLVAIAVGRNNSNLLQNISCPIALHLSYNEEDQQQNMHKDAFVAALFTTMQQRFKQVQAAKKQPNAVQLPCLVIVIDELFHLVLTQKKQTGICFLQLLVLGKQVNMHCIAASASTYRNLLIQLIHLHPSVEKQLVKRKLKGLTQIVKPLGAEMVINADNLVFYKTADMQHYNRYFTV